MNPMEAVKFAISYIVVKISCCVVSIGQAATMGTIYPVTALSPGLHVMLSQVF